MTDNLLVLPLQNAGTLLLWTLVLVFAPFPVSLLHLDQSNNAQELCESALLLWEIDHRIWISKRRP